MCALILFRELRDKSRSRLGLAQTRAAIHTRGKLLFSLLFATSVSFGRFECCGIPFHNIHKSLEFVRIHFRKIHLKKFAVCQHLLLGYAVCFLDFLTGIHEFIKTVSSLPVLESFLCNSRRFFAIAEISFPNRLSK